MMTKCPWLRDLFLLGLLDVHWLWDVGDAGTSMHIYRALARVSQVCVACGRSYICAGQRRKGGASSSLYISFKDIKFYNDEEEEEEELVWCCWRSRPLPSPLPSFGMLVEEPSERAASSRISRLIRPWTTRRPSPHCYIPPPKKMFYFLNVYRNFKISFKSKKKQSKKFSPY